MKTYSMTKDESNAINHTQILALDHAEMSKMWENKAGLIIASILKRVGEEPDKVVADNKKINIDFEKGIIEISDKEEPKPVIEIAKK
jgi:hypothetical protein